MLLGNFGGVGCLPSRSRKGPKLSIVEYSRCGSVFPEIFRHLRALGSISRPFFRSCEGFLPSACKPHEICPRCGG